MTVKLYVFGGCVHERHDSGNGLVVFFGDDRYDDVLSAVKREPRISIDINDRGIERGQDRDNVVPIDVSP